MHLTQATVAGRRYSHNAETEPIARRRFAALRRFAADRLAVTGAVILLLFGGLAILAPVTATHVTGFQPEAIELRASLRSPGWRLHADAPVHWLGTDELGRDVLTRLMFGARVSLTIALLTVGASTAIGALLGALAGYLGGVWDTLVSGLINVLLSVPLLFLLLLVGSLLQPPWWGMAFVLASVSWMAVARLVRGEFLAIKARDYVEAAKACGVSHGRIVLRHMLPNAATPITVAASLQVGTVILTEAALSFLGFGVRPPVPSWGNMLSNAQQYLYQSPTLILAPGIMIFLTVLAVNWVGNGLRDALDPYIRPN